MKFDVTTPLTKLDGTDMFFITSNNIEFCKECTVKLKQIRKPLTLRLACTRSLTAITQESSNIDWQEKFERGELARRIHNDDNPSLSPDDVVLLKKVIGTIEGPLVILQAFELLGIK